MPRSQESNDPTTGNTSQPRDAMQSDPLDPLTPRKLCVVQVPSQRVRWRLDTNDWRSAKQRGQSDFTEHCLIFERKTQHRRRRRSCLRMTYRRRGCGYREVGDSLSRGYIGKAKRRAWPGLRVWPEPARTETNQENHERHKRQAQKDPRRGTCHQYAEPVSNLLRRGISVRHYPFA
jgi:hypothetical protein